MLFNVRSIGCGTPQEELTFFPTMNIDRVEMPDDVIDRVDSRKTQMLNEVRWRYKEAKKLTNEVVDWRRLRSSKLRWEADEEKVVREE